MILLTGFEPFGGDTENPSIVAARSAAEELNRSGRPAVAVELPCVFATAPHALREALRTHQPELVVCTGLSARAASLTLERAALNVIDARIPDNSGAQPVDVPVVPGGPAAYFTTLPIKRALAALRAEGLPAVVSQSAGTFACNQVFYALMHELAAGTVRGGFVHVPPTGPGSADPEALVRALLVVVREALDPAADVSLGAGALA
ncbi:pyroglutamyl-peptidase I [Arthrobacter sp.]|uniref:pyroglutamyl-peptidase I family protein n=1 Tax=Arthrobacter sp. TaxID=1667 RepID=UPI003A91A065